MIGKLTYPHTSSFTYTPSISGGYIEAGDMERIVNYMDEDQQPASVLLFRCAGRSIDSVSQCITACCVVMFVMVSSSQYVVVISSLQRHRSTLRRAETLQKRERSLRILACVRPMLKASPAKKSTAAADLVPNCKWKKR